MCVFLPTYWQYCFIISKAGFIISLQRGYIPCVVKTGNRGHAHRAVTCILLLHITAAPAQPSAVQRILTATVLRRIKKPDPTRSRAVLSSQSQKAAWWVFVCVRASGTLGTCQSPWSFLNEVLWEMRVYLI